MIENFDNWKCRCSALGNVVTKSGKLTDGAETFLNEVFISELYGVQKEAYGRQLDKGISCEPEGFKMLGDALYPERFPPEYKKLIENGKITPPENDYIKGTPDTIMDDIIYDIKNAWDRFTFGKADLTHTYKWQLKGYLFKYQKQHGRLFYCLNNMPEHLLISEEDKMYFTKRRWTSKLDTDYLKACEELRAAHNYDHMPIHHKFKIWDVDLTDNDIEKIQVCIGWAREYLNGLLVQHKERLIKNLMLMQPNVAVA